MSTFGAVPDDFDYEFNPVRRAPEEEMADLASKNTDSVTKAFQAGLISQKVALKELRQQSEQTGIWSNITDEDIEKADDDVVKLDEGMMNMSFGDEKVQTQDSWDEEKHPRNPDGTFGSGGTMKFVRNRERKTLQLPREEYAHVMSELNTHLTEEQRSKKYVQKAIGDYLYTVENNGFNDYRIIGKIKME